MQGNCSKFKSLKFELIRDNMDVFVTFKNKEDPNKNEGAKVATTLNIDFSHSQGQITLQSGSDLAEIRNTQGQITPQSEVGSVVKIRTYPRC